MFHIICLMGENTPCYFLWTFQENGNNAFSNLYCLETQSQGTTAGYIWIKHRELLENYKGDAQKIRLLEQLVWIKQTSLLSEPNSLKIHNESDLPGDLSTHKRTQTVPIWTIPTGSVSNVCSSLQYKPYVQFSTKKWVVNSQHLYFDHM